MRRIAPLVMLLASGTAGAQTLYKCVSASVTSYQQAPCPRLARTARMFDVSPEPPLTAAERADQAGRLDQARIESAFLSHMAGTDRMDAGIRTPRRRMPRAGSRTGRAVDRCDAAKATRATVLRSIGLGRTIDLLRKLDADVADACH
jgi:hypothetical protein